MINVLEPIFNRYRDNGRKRWKVQFWDVYWWNRFHKLEIQVVQEGEGKQIFELYTE